MQLDRAMKNLIASIIEIGLDLLLPPVCLTCERLVWQEGGLCPKCCSEVSFVEQPYCEKTGIPFSHEIMFDCRNSAFAEQSLYHRARFAVLYTGPSSRLVRGRKDHDQTHLAELIGRLTTKAGHDLFHEADLIVPIPLHHFKLIVRRFNQSAMIANVVSEISGLPIIASALKRIRHTQQQVGLPSTKRMRNMEGAFLVPTQTKKSIVNKNIIIVDDVITTGATATAATQALLQAGAARVEVLTFARVPTRQISSTINTKEHLPTI